MTLVLMQESGASPQDENVLFPERNRGATGVYCKWQTHKLYKAVESNNVAIAWCNLVSGQDDPYTCGTISDPAYAKRLDHLSDQVCPQMNDESSSASFSKTGATPFSC
jgi:hypothetical protein